MFHIKSERECCIGNECCRFCYFIALCKFCYFIAFCRFCFTNTLRRFCRGILFYKFLHAIAFHIWRMTSFEMTTHIAFLLGTVFALSTFVSRFFSARSFVSLQRTLDFKAFVTSVAMKWKWLDNCIWNLENRNVWLLDIAKQ